MPKAAERDDQALAAELRESVEALRQARSAAREADARFTEAVRQQIERSREILARPFVRL